MLLKKQYVSTKPGEISGRADPSQIKAFFNLHLPLAHPVSYLNPSLRCTADEIQKQAALFFFLSR